MAIVLKTTYSSGLTQAGLSDQRFSLSVRTKVADLTQVQTECARLYAVLQASVENALQNHGSSVRLNLNGHGERRHMIRSLRGDRSTWTCSRKQQQLLRRFIAKCNLDWSFIERAAQERFAKPVQALNQSQARELIRVLHE